ncbi:hypothetical protein P280DRAFT_483605 [Massarina eburnea CBS 473.64]|uniref:Uncharacterized protein n=1 Tax=Massarina eburnea CBS 473.64 TaxID=1395130 RepID=A0A6A6RNA8_9PLEO|nr:hypothetical protein P280DRAFT_483605 [Massarina eburnea CBS 473.64]
MELGWPMKTGDKVGSIRQGEIETAFVRSQKSLIRRPYRIVQAVYASVNKLMYLEITKSLINNNNNDGRRNHRTEATDGTRASNGTGMPSKWRRYGNLGKAIASRRLLQRARRVNRVNRSRCSLPFAFSNTANRGSSAVPKCRSCRPLMQPSPAGQRFRHEPASFDSSSPCFRRDFDIFSRGPRGAVQAIFCWEKLCMDAPINRVCSARMALSNGQADLVAPWRPMEPIEPIERPSVACCLLRLCRAMYRRGVVVVVDCRSWAPPTGRLEQRWGRRTVCVPASFKLWRCVETQIRQAGCIVAKSGELLPLA